MAKEIYCAAEADSFSESEFARDKNNQLHFPHIHLKGYPHFTNGSEVVPRGPDPTMPSFGSSALISEVDPLPILKDQLLDKDFEKLTELLRNKKHG
jgi:hypothetical protein